MGRGITGASGRRLFTSAGKYFRIQLKSAKTMSGKDKDVKEKKNAAGILLFILAAAMAAFSFSLCGAEDIWYDELFTMSFVRQPVGKLLELAAQDVHPPLYYLIVKAVLECVRLVLPAMNEVAAAKMVSVLPYLGLLAYSAVLVRKRDGWLCAGLFAFCLLSMPQLSNYTTEIRMYGWALFFLTAAFLHMREILLAGKKLHWAAFWFYGICAAYTHYFAAVSAFFLYLSLAGLLLWKHKKEGGSAGSGAFLRTSAPWLACVALSVLAYLPWLPSAIRQVSAVREDYWILPLEWSCFGGCVKFVLKPSTGYQLPDYVLAVLLFGSLLLLLLRAFLNRKKEEAFWRDAAYASCGIWVLAGTALFGIAVSFLMRPVFVYRYMLPALGGFWFCFAWFVSGGRAAEKEGHTVFGWKAVRIISLLLLLAVGLMDYRSFAQGELLKSGQMERTLQAFDGLGEDSVVLFNFDQVQAVAGYYLDRETWLYGDEPEALIAKMLPQTKAGGDAQWVEKLLEEGRTVWFVGSNLAREAVLAQWKERGIVPAETVDSLLLERYWFNLYRLTLAG